MILHELLAIQTNAMYHEKDGSPIYPKDLYALSLRLGEKDTGH